jgi:hypothetical protein
MCARLFFIGFAKVTVFLLFAKPLIVGVPYRHKADFLAIDSMAGLTGEGRYSIVGESGRCLPKCRHHAKRLDAYT